MKPFEDLLPQARKTRIRAAIAAYAAEAAGTRDDLDEDLEAASLEMWHCQRSRRSIPGETV